MTRAFLLLAGVLAAFSEAGCSEVAEVLHAAAGSGALTGGAFFAGSGGSAALGGGTALGGSAGLGDGGALGGGAEPSTGGAQAADPSLGVFVDSGNAHTCAARFGILYCWGANADGRLGVGDLVDRNAPTRVGFDADWITVATGIAHTCALKQNGSVWCFGANMLGQLGQGNVAPSNVPLRVSLPGKAVQLSSEADTACVVLDDGALYCWGRNVEGNIGLGDNYPGPDQRLPVRSGEQSDWKVVGTGDGHTCGIRGAGLLFGWGRNSQANLGLGQTNELQRRSATQIGTDEDWLSVVSGQDSSCGIRGPRHEQGETVNGDLFCWGENSFGNLGMGDREQRLVPTPLAPDKTWSQVAIDTFHGCSIDSEQNLYCWGRGIEGQLGTGDNAERLSPVLIGPGFSQVVVGRMSSCAVALELDGDVLCTGENASGQLGLADNMRRNTFTRVRFP
jgi:alpha-tubulin suppressor-like RCC1 family protein